MKARLRILQFTCLFVLTFFVQAQREDIASSFPDIIYYNGYVISMDPAIGVQDAIAIKDDKIQRIGSSKVVLRTAGRNTIKIDLKRRTILPGFVDAHSHLFQLEAETSSSLKGVQYEYFKNGITTVGQPAVVESVLNNIQDFAASGDLQMNIDLYLMYNSNCNEPANDWFLAYPPTTSSEAKLRIAGVKIFTDGGTCETIAALTFPYPDPELGYGDLFLTHEELEVLSEVADANGYQILMHAQGDAAVNMALDVLETVLAGGSNPLRHRIDHNSFMDPDNMSRYTEVGISPVIFGHMPTCYESNGAFFSNFYGAEHIGWLENWRLMHDENPELPIGWHSDAPNLILDPIRHMASYVSRLDIDEDGSWCTPPDWLAEHAITIEETLKLMTIGAAYTLNRDEFIGTLTPGKYADLVFLSENPLIISATDLFNNQVVGTMSKGQMVYCSKYNTDLCKVLGVSGLRSGSTRINSLNVYPNPAKDRLQMKLEFDKNSEGSIKILNLSGQVFYESNESFHAGINHWDWDCSGVSKGIYLLQLQTEGGISSIKVRIEN